jgi:hypothetical protein
MNSPSECRRAVSRPAQATPSRAPSGHACSASRTNSAGSGRCHRLRYCSQRETKEDRAMRAMLKIVRRLNRVSADGPD